jgi:hypothetical protein
MLERVAVGKKSHPIMSPSWKFPGEPTPTNLVGPFFVRPWPDDLPEKCEVCGTEFRYGFNLTIGPGKTGRILRAIAYFGFLPFLVIGFILPGIFPDMYYTARKPWWLFFGVMFIPPMFFGGLSVIMPQTRRVECKKCGWSHDYKIRKPAPLAPDS